eukprot:scaffold248392_cov40-Cyclotella_meneghiniana.AAC.1
MAMIEDDAISRRDAIYRLLRSISLICVHSLADDAISRRDAIYRLLRSISLICVHSLAMNQENERI